MKKLLWALLVVFGSTLSQAAFQPTVYSFKFNSFQGEVLRIDTQASSPTEAYTRAAQACFDHFKAGRHVSMDFGQDIIDICVNPISL